MKSYFDLAEHYKGIMAYSTGLFNKRFESRWYPVYSNGLTSNKMSGSISIELAPSYRDERMSYWRIWK